MKYYFYGCEWKSIQEKLYEGKHNARDVDLTDVGMIIGGIRQIVKKIKQS